MYKCNKSTNPYVSSGEKSCDKEAWDPCESILTFVTDARLFPQFISAWFLLSPSRKAYFSLTQTQVWNHKKFASVFKGLDKGMLFSLSFVFFGQWSELQIVSQN